MFVKKDEGLEQIGGCGFFCLWEVRERVVGSPIKKCVWSRLLVFHLQLHINDNYMAT